MKGNICKTMYNYEYAMFLDLGNTYRPDVPNILSNVIPKFKNSYKKNYLNYQSWGTHLSNRLGQGYTAPRDQRYMTELNH